MNDAKQLAHGYTYDPVVFDALASLTTHRIEGKEHNAKRPKTSLRMNADKCRDVIFRPQITSSPLGWCVGAHIRAEVIAIAKLNSVEIGKTDVIADLRPDGSIRGRRWWADHDRTRAGFDALSGTLHLLATSPEAAVNRNSHNCVICGRGLTDPESQSRGIGPECLQWWEELVSVIDAKSGRMREVSA